MNELNTIRCVACEGGVPPLAKEEVSRFLSQINGWQVSTDNQFISRRLTFKIFIKRWLLLMLLPGFQTKKTITLIWKLAIITAQ